MSNRIRMSTLAAALAITATSAFAASADENSRAAESTKHVEMIKPEQMRASEVLGSTVYDVQNQKVGDVKDIILDKDGKVADVVVNVGEFLGVGGKNVALRPSDIKTDHNRLTIDKSKDQLNQMAEYKLTDRDTGAGSSSSPVHGGSMAPSSSTTH